MSGTRAGFSAMLRGSLVLTFAAVALRGTPALAQNTNLQATIVNTTGSPTGTDFQMGMWVTATISYTITCNPAKLNCVLSIQATGPLSKPSSGATQLQFSLNGVTWTPVTTTSSDLLTVSTATAVTGTISLRYQLGWAGTNPFTPVGVYTLPISLTLTQGM
jgi:hypothetical protein